MATIGEQVREARQARHLSLAQLASASGLSKGFLSQLESGISNPSLASLNRLASALDVSVRSLMSGSNDRTTNPLVPAFPGLVIPGTLSDIEGFVAVVSASEAGTHIIVHLPIEMELLARDGSAATIIATILDGSIEVTQSSGSLVVSTGQVATWNGAYSYSITPRQNSAARLMLFVPQPLALPELRQANRAEKPVTGRMLSTLGKSTHSISRSKVATSAGPLRLVAMRAERLAERKRNP